MHRAVEPHRHLAQGVEVAHPVDVGEEAGLAVVAALHDVLRHAGKIESWGTGHGALPGRRLHPALP